VNRHEAPRAGGSRHPRNVSAWGQPRPRPATDGTRHGPEGRHGDATAARHAPGGAQRHDSHRATAVRVATEREQSVHQRSRSGQGAALLCRGRRTAIAATDAGRRGAERLQAAGTRFRNQGTNTII